MLADIVRKTKDISLRIQDACISLTRNNPYESEIEIAALKDEHRDLSAKVFAQQEITRCIDFLANKRDCMSPELMGGVRTKAGQLIKITMENRRVIRFCETERFHKKSERFLSEKAYQEALHQCEQILSKEPWHQKTRDLLNAVIYEVAPPLKAKINTILQRFQFQHVQSFGQGILSQPHDVHVSQDGTTLFVSDDESNTVHRFSVSGEYLGRCFISTTKPRGIFSDVYNNVWVCDMEGQRLICINQQGEQQAEWYLPNYLENGCATTYPCWGTHSNGTTTLILTDREKQMFSLRNFLGGTINKKWQKHLFDEIDVPCGLGWYNGNFWVGSMSHGCLYITSEKESQLHPVKIKPISHRLKAFAASNNAFFLNYGDTLTKITSSGTVIYSVDLASCLGLELCLNFGLAVLEGTSSKILFAPDGLNKCIHVFSV